MYRRSSFDGDELRELRGVDAPHVAVMLSLSASAVGGKKAQAGDKL